MVNNIFSNSQSYQNYTNKQPEKNQDVQPTAAEHIGKEKLLSSSSAAEIPAPPPLENVSQISTEYWTLTRRIPKEIFTEINQIINALPDKDMRISQLLTALKEKNWEHEIFQDKNYPYYALESVKQKKLSSSEFCTLMFYWTAVNYHSTESERVKPIPLFIDGIPNSQALQMLKETMSHSTNLSLPFLTDEQFDEFINLMSKAPISEQQFFLVPLSNEYTSLQNMRDLKINLFGKVESENKRMIPSFSLMQCFLDVKFGSQAAKINPVIGLSHFKDIIANDVGGQRDMAIPFPGVKLPERADNILAPGFDFTYHDLYHIFILSCIPLEHRQALIKAAFYSIDAINDSNIQAKKYYGTIVDMDAPVFRENNSSLTPTREEKVWIELILGCLFNSLGYRNTIDITTLDPFFNVLESAIQNRKEWKEEFGISVDLTAIKATCIKFFDYPFWNEAFESYENAEIIQSNYQQNKDSAAEEFILSLTKNQLNNKFSSRFLAGFTDKEALRKTIKYLSENYFKNIDFSGCKLLDDSHIETLVQSGRPFNSLKLSGCTGVTGETMKSLKKLPVPLNSLSLNGCNQLLDSLLDLPSGLQRLDLSGIKGLTDKHVEEIVKACPNLREVKLNRCSLITDKALNDLKSLKHLETVEVKGCVKLSEEGVIKLAADYVRRVNVITL